MALDTCSGTSAINAKEAWLKRHQSSLVCEKLWVWLPVGLNLGNLAKNICA